MKTTDFNKACAYYVDKHDSEFLNWVHGGDDYEAMKGIIETAFLAGAKWQKSKQV